MIDVDHIHEEFRHVLGLSDDDRIRFMQEPRWVVYPAAKNLLGQLQMLMDAPKRPRMPNLLIIGEPNNGKTTIIRHFYDLYGETTVYEDGRAQKPIVLVEAPPSANEKDLLAHILQRLFAPHRPSDTALKLRRQVVDLLRTFDTRMLIIDEFHSMLTGTARQRLHVMNVIKYLCNELAIPIVGVGIGEAVKVLHADPQHASRFDVATLPVWKLNTDFQRFLVGIEKTLPLRKHSRLNQRELARPLFAISQGNTGNLYRFLTECAEAAIRSGQEFIDKPLIEKHIWVRRSDGIRARQL